MNFASNRRSFFYFETTDGAGFAFSGGKDRQPNLENYYLSIDNIGIN